MQITINTEIKINEVEDLSKLKIIMEANDLDKPNFSKIAKEMGVDRRTVKKYYEGNHKEIRKQKISKIDEYKDIIERLLFSDTKQIFYYKNHLYRYLVREHGLNCSRSNFNRFILLNSKYAEYFNPKDKANAIKTETPFGKQAQFDWKENIKFYLKDGTYLIVNVGSLILSASRMKVWTVYLSMNQECLFDFLSNAFEILGGVPQEIWIDNAKTMMEKPRTEYNHGKCNNKFQQFADDYGFKIKPCVSRRPKTKAKVENPMRIIDELMNYNGQLNDLKEIYEKLKIINNEANSRICQATGLPPILLYSKEKEHLLPLPSEKVCSCYKIPTKKSTVGTDALVSYNQNKYSVDPKLIGKEIEIKIIENNLYVYYNKELVTVHPINIKKINYHEDDHKELIKMTFPNMEEDEIKEYSLKHLKELEVYNEQLSAASK